MKTMANTSDDPSVSNVGVNDYMKELGINQPPPPSLEKPTDDELLMIKEDLWRTVVSSAHPQSAAAIENHFRADTGYRLDTISQSLGFRTTELLLCSDHCSEIIQININKDELEEYASKTFSAISFDDIMHITNLMSESALSEEEKEARKEYHRVAKYSTIEFQEKGLEIRERISKIALQYSLDEDTEIIPWDQIQHLYKTVHGQELTKKYLREAFPTGHPTKIIETYMNEEFVLHDHDSSTGVLSVKFRKPYSEIEEMYKEAKEALKNHQKVLKAPVFRTRDNIFVDYVREREKKEILRQQNAEGESSDKSKSFYRNRNNGDFKSIQNRSESVNRNYDQSRSSALQNRSKSINPRSKTVRFDLPNEENSGSYIPRKSILQPNQERRRPSQKWIEHNWEQQLNKPTQIRPIYPKNRQ